MTLVDFMDWYKNQKHVMKRVYIARTDASLAPTESYERQLSIGAKLGVETKNTT